MERTQCPHIIAHMDMDMAPCLHLYHHMDWIAHLLSALLLTLDMDIAPWLHIITHMDMDMTPCLHICHFKFIIPY